MKKVSLVAAAGILALALVGCASGPALIPSGAAKRSYAVPLSSSGGGSDFHLMRTEQLRAIPAGASIGVLSGEGGTLPLYLEADLEAKGFTVRQIDIYSLVSGREKALTDPSSDFVFINSLVDNLPKLDKENLNASIEKLLPTDRLYVENQLADHYVNLYQNLKKMINLLNVDYLVVAGPAYRELSYAMKIYDAGKLDLVYTCMFVGDVKEWRTVVGTPQKSPSLSYAFPAGNEPSAFWEMSFSKFATDRIKTGNAPAAKQ